MDNELKDLSIKNMLLMGNIINLVISLILILIFSDLSYLIKIFKLPSVHNILISLLFTFALVLFIFIFVKYKGLTIKSDKDAKKLLESYATTKNMKLIPRLFLTSVSEELLFRAALLGALTIFLNIYLAVLISIIVFVLPHAKQYTYDPFSLIIIALLGFFTSWSFLLEISIWGPVLIHTIYNVMIITWIRNGFLTIK